MPPIPDKHLEARILRAAGRLFQARGEKGLTLRALAREAGTTTPTLYTRFSSKDALRLALANHFREEATADFLQATTIEDVYRRYMVWAAAHPRKYQLVRAYWGHFISTPRPGRPHILGLLAERFGGDPEEYTTVYDAIFLLCHGASTLIAAAPNQQVVQATRDLCIQVCDKLVENAAALRGSRSSAASG